ncbi:hypothetical protein ACFYL6_21230 [Micromonospora sp. NPDC007208]
MQDERRTQTNRQVQAERRTQANRQVQADCRTRDDRRALDVHVMQRDLRE